MDYDDFFKAIASKQYCIVCQEFADKGSTYPLPFDDVLDVFITFFEGYKDHFHEEHPHVKGEQVRKIIRRIPWLDDTHDTFSDIDLDADAYAVIIPKYFATPFRNCNYRINHFFSGQVRALRYFELLY